MKTKGITLVERHAEKIVLGLFVLGALTILLLQTGLLGRKEGIPVGGIDRPIDRALAAVRDSALQRRARIESDQVAPGVPETIPDPVDVFERAMRQPPLGSQPLVALGASPVRLDPSGTTLAPSTTLAVGDTLYTPVAIPATSAPIACVFEGTIDPIEVANIGPPLASLLPPVQPYDTRAVSIQASFDAHSLRRSIEQPAGEGLAPIPVSLWQGRLELVDVVWIRQELTESGTWSNDTILPPLPGRHSLRGLAENQELQAAGFAELLDRERVHRPDIRRPAFYSTISGQFWTWPEQARKEAELREAEDIVTLRGELTRIRRKIEEIRKEIDALGRPTRQPTPPSRDRRPPAGGGGGGDRNPSADTRPIRTNTDSDADPFHWPIIQRTWLAQSGPGTGGGAPPPPPPEGGGSQPDDRRRDREAQARKRLEDELARHTKREQEILAELQKKGVTETGDVIASEFTEPFNSLAHPDSKQITLWTHDLSVRPGATYRYRARVRATNPFFGQADRLKPEQRDLALHAVITGPESEWSEPVRLDPPLVYYLTSATEAGGLLDNPARAGVEVFEFFYGYWRRGTAALAPGDPIIASVELPELVTFELERDATGRLVVKDRKPIDKQRVLRSPVFLIDVASSVGGGQGGAQAYVRDEQGRVTVRRPVAGDTSESRHRAALNTSAQIGRTASLREPGTGAPATPFGGQGAPPGTGPGLPGGTPPPGPGGPPSLPKRDERN